MPQHQQWKVRLRLLRSSLFEIGQLREQIKDIEDRMYSPKGQKFTSMPHSQSTDGHTMDDLVIAKMALEELYNRKLAGIFREKASIEKAMQILTPEQRMVLRGYYFEGMRWEDVCVNVGYGWAQVHRFHSAALRKLEEQYWKAE